MALKWFRKICLHVCGYKYLCVNRCTSVCVCMCTHVYEERECDIGKGGKIYVTKLRLAVLRIYCILLKNIL